VHTKHFCVFTDKNATEIEQNLESNLYNWDIVVWQYKDETSDTNVILHSNKMTTQNEMEAICIIVYITLYTQWQWFTPNTGNRQ